jgi:lysocardiolipin and lysophospholipid acyltransferase
MKDQLKQLDDGRIECDFPERLVLIANHQIYTDWLYLWWAAYTSGMHGHIYIILKESLKYVPLIGPAMTLWGFIFMARKWETDQPRLRHRLQKLNARHSGPLAGEKGALDPMWLLIFPEGTNLSRNTRNQSARWSAKSGIPDVKHCLLPRSTGLQFCLKELDDTVEYLYDCTIAYEGTTPDRYGSELFTLRSVYFQGRQPKSVNMHWRRFKVADIPKHDQKAMEEWTQQRWQEKDQMMDYYLREGTFPGDAAAIRKDEVQSKPSADHIETEVRPASPLEFLQIFVPVIGTVFIGRIMVKLVNFAVTGKMSDV